MVNILFLLQVRALECFPPKYLWFYFCIQNLTQTIVMFLEHWADITIYNVKSPVQSTTVGFSSQGQADLNWFTLSTGRSCVIPSKHAVPSEGEMLQLVL